MDLVVKPQQEGPRGLKLETAAHGYQALIKAGSFRISLPVLDVLLPRLDVLLPQVDRIEVCRHLKANRESRSIRILGVTGHLDGIPALLEAGADVCLARPLDLRRMRQEVDRLLVQDP